MKIKLDENFGTRSLEIFRSAGHDVHTVYQESLQGATDQQLYQVCRDEPRCLVTLDMDFASVLRFPPAATGGIVIFRMPKNPSLPILEQLVGQLLDALQEMSVLGQLWIVEPGRIRIHQSDDDDDL